MFYVKEAFVNIGYRSFRFSENWEFICGQIWLFFCKNTERSEFNPQKCPDDEKPKFIFLENSPAKYDLPNF